MSARERILDAAADVIRDLGLARATTREIARAAGYSEALLYKHFDDKQAIYLAVLGERFGSMLSVGELVGTSTVRDNLVTITARLMDFYVRTFPMSASIFGDRVLLANWRASLAERGAGPQGPVRIISSYLSAERAGGRVELDEESVSTLLCGAAFQQAFLACFDGLDAVPDTRALAGRLVDALLR